MRTKSKLQQRIEELEQFISDLEEAKKFSEERPNSIQISPIAGILEKQELESLKKIWEATEH